MPSSKPSYCPKCYSSKIKSGKTEMSPSVMGGLGGAVGLIAIGVAWVFASAINASEHDWKCEDCGHEFSGA